MRFKLIEEFKDKDYRDRHYDEHVLGKDQFHSGDLLFDLYDYPDTEEGREQYERDADNFARMYESAGLSGKFQWMPSIKVGDVVGFIGKAHDNFQQECYVLYQKTNEVYGKLVVFIPHSPLAKRTGNLIKTYYKVYFTDYKNLLDTDYVNELPQNQKAFTDYYSLPQEERDQIRKEQQKANAEYLYNRHQKLKKEKSKKKYKGN